MLMTRATVVLSLAVAAGLLEVGTGRPVAAQQASGAQGAAQTPAPDPAAAAPQQSGDAPQQPTFRADINYVRVDVIVNDDKGTPVTDLKITDFEVLEDGKPQSIDQFRLVRVDGNPAPGAPPPRELRNRLDEEIEISKDDVRLFVFFFDDYHVRLGNSLSVKEPADSLRANAAAAERYRRHDVSTHAGGRDFLHAESGVDHQRDRKLRRAQVQLPASQPFEEQYARAPSEIVEQIRNQVVMGALRGLSTRLGGLREGRKAVIYVSEGFTAMLPPQLRTADASMGRMGTVGRTSPMTGENSQREETAAFFSESDLYSQLREVFTAANRNNTAYLFGGSPRIDSLRVRDR